MIIGSKKQHKYFIDVKDMISVLSGTASLMKRTSLENFINKNQTQQQSDQSDVSSFI